MDKCPQELIECAHKLADASAKIVCEHFRSPFIVESKEDLSPVTVADQKAEKIMRALIQELRPKDGIIGEEYGKEREDAEYVWVIDPIDGTRAFASGKPLFGTLIAVLKDGAPILGLIDQPILKERWVGAMGYKTTLNGEQCQTRPCENLSKAVSNMGSQAFPYGNAVSLDAYRRVDKASLTTTVGGDCYSYGLLASGHIDFVIEHGLKLYDYAALIPVIEGAGGRITDWQGNKLTLDSVGQVMAFGDSKLLDETIELLEGVL